MPNPEKKRTVNEIRLKAMSKAPTVDVSPTTTPPMGMSPERYVGNYLQDQEQSRFAPLPGQRPREMSTPMMADGFVNSNGMQRNPVWDRARQQLMLMGLAAGFPRDMLERDLGQEKARLDYRAKYGLNPGEPLSKRNDYGE